MRQCLHTLDFQTHGKQLYNISLDVLSFVRSTHVTIGLVTIFCRHTSASLLIQENADPSVQIDIGRFFDGLVGEGDAYEHSDEGSDDMPAHIRTALTQSHLAIPIAEGEPTLGKWQAIYLFEHRRRPRRRQVVIHVLGV